MSMTCKPACGRKPGRYRYRHAAPRRMRGVGLIEVMVSVLILAVGLLGIAAMQAMALRGGQSSLETSMAVMQTNAILEAMRANRANAAAYNTAGMVCDTGAGGSLAANDVDSWITSMKQSITGDTDDTTTCGQITGCPAACEITVRWDDSRAGGGGGRTLVTESQI